MEQTEHTFSIAGHSYHAKPCGEHRMRVTGPIRDDGGALVPKIVALVAGALQGSGFPASPWAGYWTAGDNYIDFEPSTVHAWTMTKADFRAAINGDQECQQCHADAHMIARRRALAERIGLAPNEREFWRDLEEINERYTVRIAVLWSAFDHPAKEWLGGALIPFFAFPAPYYLAGDVGRGEDPQPGDLEWVLVQLARVADLAARIFNIDLEVRQVKAAE